MLSWSMVLFWAAIPKMPKDPKIWEFFLHENPLIVGGFVVLVAGGVGGSYLIFREYTTSGERHRSVEQIPEATPKVTDSSSAGAGDRLSSSVFAPPAAKPGAEFLVQVFAYLAEHEQRVGTTAREVDDEATRRNTTPLESPVFEGERLAFELLLPGLVVDDPVQSMLWVESPQSVQFGVTVPLDFTPRNVVGTVRISRGSVPIGHVKFKVSVIASGAMPDTVAESAPTHGMDHYRKAFISYASSDRNEVLKRTQMLAAEGTHFFQDILALDPGERWERRLYCEIDRCDVFYLFWSCAAKESTWVLKEVNYAITRQGGDELAPPEIFPIIIEAPPVDPPPELAHLHFNDPMIYLMQPSGAA